MTMPKPLIITLRKSLYPFIFGSILALLVTIIPLQTLTAYRFHRDQQKIVTATIASTIQKYLTVADTSLTFLSKQPTERMNDHLTSFQESFKIFSKIAFADTDGTVVAANSKIQAHQDVSNLLHEAVPTPGLTSLSTGPIISPHTGKLCIFLVHPLEGQGNIIAELNNNYLFDQMMQTIGMVNIENLVFVTDQSGNLLLHPDPRLLQQKANWGDLPVIHDIRQNDGETSAFVSIGERLYIAVARSIPETHWILTYAVPISATALEIIGSLVLTTLLFLFFIGSVLIILKRTLENNIVRPLTQMQHIIEQSVIEKTPQTIGVIANSFSELETMRKVFNRLSKTIRQKTLSLIEFKRAVREAGHAIYMTDREGIITYTNPAFERITGYSWEEAEGKTPNILNSGMMPESYFARLWESILAGELWEEEIINRKQDGTIYYAHQTIAPIFSDFGMVISFVAIQNDVTQQRESERRLWESETLYRNLFETAADSILLINPETLGISECNQATIESLGYGKDEIKQLSYLDIQPPDHQQRVKELVQGISEFDQATFDTQHTTKTGELREVNVHMTLLNLDQRKLLLAIMHDVTERRQAERTIQQSERKYRMLAENSSDMISQHAPGGIYLYVSPACIRLLGYEQEELLGRQVEEIIHPEDIERVIEIGKNHLGSPSERITTLVYRIQKKDGSYTWFETHSRRTDSQEIIAISRDISERIAMERGLEEANKAKSMFLANMSHEIRTPLNAVLGFNDLIARNTSDPKLKEYAAQIDLSGKNLLTLIGDILDFSKVEAGGVQFNYDFFSPHHLVREIIALFEMEAKKRGIDLITKERTPIPKQIKLDEDRVRQILINLVSNALKFTEKGSVCLEIHAAYIKQKDQRCNLTFSVIDTGIGIPEKEQHVIFEAFRQQEGQSTRKYGGTGLGLAISKNLAEGMEGSIDVKSNVGSGSTFTLSFDSVEWRSADDEEGALQPDEKHRKEHDSKRQSSIVLPASLQKQWEAVRLVRAIDEIADFAELLKREASKEEHPELIDFANQLERACDELDIEEIEYLLEKTGP
ncbi:multi-sensor signal transduction histidine kinase [Sediminispirochaeta smaragdinae DSM 11293]|uniref:histidine kinase n=2 Tax=Sediminispirochaeta TaxID=1911556 RepID=E1RBF0_SEDSS|nr:multi-sensor signal transduction histidine kinase [Sediminispirochaeta smaragdinae DSM 11293]